MNAAANNKVYVPFEYSEQIEALSLKAKTLRGLYDGFITQFVDKNPETCALEIKSRFACYESTAHVLTDLIYDLMMLAQQIDNSTQIAVDEGGAGNAE